MRIRQRFQLFAIVVLPFLLTGCGSGGGQPDKLWGKRGLQPGDFVRPRAVAISRDELFIVDFTARIQVFTLNGEYLRGWSTPAMTNGRPAGLGIGNNGDVLVADSHYNQVLVYAPDGTLKKTIRAATGDGPGPFAYVSDVTQDADGFYYITEFGDEDRVRKLTASGGYVAHWGGHGSEPGQFARPRAITLGPDGLLYVADSCNHRVQVFDRSGKLMRVWGEKGSGLGQLNYPYDVTFGPNGDVYIAEFGNHRVQRFSTDGNSKGVWGGPGREPGMLNSPWGLAVDRLGRVHTMDTENHRVQRFEF